MNYYIVNYLCTVISNKEKLIQKFLFYLIINIRLYKKFIFLQKSLIILILPKFI